MQVDQDLGLDMHTDDSDVTFNVCLGKDFDGAGLQFCGTMGHRNHRHQSLVYHHVKGRCVVHLGRTRHGADDITRGTYAVRPAHRPCALLPSVRSRCCQP